MKRIAVIVPIYNAQEYLEECLDSISGQTYQNLEIILVDDGSTDESGKICDGCAERDERVKVIHQENQGKHIARYKGVAVSDADYIAFVDADDWLDLDAYERIAIYLEHQYDVVMFGKVLEKGDKGKTYYKSNYHYGEYDRKDIELEIFPTMIWNIANNGPGISQSMCDKVIKTEIVKKVFKDAKGLGRINFAEDSLMVYPMMQEVDSLYIMEDNLYHYRKTYNEVPEYLYDDSFFEMIYKWYIYLKERMDFVPNARQQLEYQYIMLAEQRKHIYGVVTAEEDYFFPFREVASGSKIVLWGAGKIGKTYYRQIKRSQYCEVVAWVDKNNKLYKDLPVQSTDVVNVDLEFDYIVIAIYSEYEKENVVSILVDRGIALDKVVWKREYR
ncbi:MAG: glycosyltransferase [Lachnospiraceae bacterium]|nr:glycosyltransferase [Lachnospiraceae bacterium]